MARLRVTVTLSLSAQEFLLDAPVITVGKLPDSVLTLPFAWVGATHLIISDDPSGGLRVKAPSELRKAELHGLPISTEGLLVPGGEPFEILIFSPANDPLTLRFDPTLTPALSPETQALLAGKMVARTHKREIGIGAGVLVGATILACYLAFSGPASIPRGNGTGELTAAQIESRKQLDAAATAYLAGDLSAARHAMTMTSETGVVADSLSLAIKRAQDAAAAPATSRGPSISATPTPATADATMPAAKPTSPKDDRVLFEGKLVSPAEKEQILAARAATAAAEKAKRDADAAAQAKAAKDQASAAEANKQIDAANAEMNAGKTFKQTELGKRAVEHAKELVRKQLGGDVNFPADNDSRIIVATKESSVTVRGFCDQLNAQKVPLRVFYFATIRPTGPNTWADENVEMLK